MSSLTFFHKHFDDYFTAMLVFSTPSWPVSVIKLWHKQLITLWATVISLVLMHSRIVNGYQLLCDAHTVLEPHRGTAAFFFFLFYSLSSFSTFSFYVFVTLTVLFLGASLVYVNNLRRTAD